MDSEKTYKFSEPIKQRADGTYVVIYNGYEYQVTDSTVAVTMADVAEYLADHPDAQVKPEV